ncbi:MAG: hypothetical protein IJ523_05440 [Succinivibrionaceae bacterium]|nr:hypothetical protein [Succinivibrionaceae bacterium]
MCRSSPELSGAAPEDEDETDDPDDEVPELPPDDVRLFRMKNAAMTATTISTILFCF